ncbi:hypothetical protein JHK87_043238 [Glycine soja]|nr:hypothetical protein JHK87_043238 [Glycine soja]
MEGNKSNVVNTAWAMLALIEAGQELTGITNRTIATAPSAYRNIFPIWALGEYRSRTSMGGLIPAFGRQMPNFTMEVTNNGVFIMNINLSVISIAIFVRRTFTIS